MPARSDTPTRRVFFALEPDARTAAALHDAAEAAALASGGRRTPPHNLHMTIAFLGAVSEPRLGQVRQVPPIHVGSFGLELDHCGYLRRARTLTLEPRSVPPPLTALYELLWRGLSRAGFERERRPFRPHVTIARRASASREPVEPVVWRVRALTLMESVPEAGGVRYRALDRWAL